MGSIGIGVFVLVGVLVDVDVLGGGVVLVGVGVLVNGGVLVGAEVLVEDGTEVLVEVLDWLGEGVGVVERACVGEVEGFIVAVLVVVGVIVIVFDGAGGCVGPGKGVVPS